MLSNRLENEAYCAADPGRQYVLYFPDGGVITLDLSDALGEFTLKWLISTRADGLKKQLYMAAGKLRLRRRARGNGRCCCLLCKRSQNSGSKGSV